ncbi:Vgb family protein, partial [Candidatus Entotheonella palauensis]|uniref:Vgb family protein n=1 Tax=Candidatus Entotheonella palauensis TaxID=93172 RepID=UPI000B7DD7B7
MSSITIQPVLPQAGVRGGRAQVPCQGLDTASLERCELYFGITATRPALASSSLVMGIVPRDADGSGLQVQQNGNSSNVVPFTTAQLLAENLHPVANPAVDHNGAIYTTISGSKGQQVPVSIYRISPHGEVEPFASGIANATALAFAPDGELYVSSRHTGKILRVDANGTVSSIADKLGIVTGIAFDSQGRLHVGDRRGTIYQLTGSGEPRSLAKLPPSIAAYHLAFDQQDRLYVSYPTLSGYDNLYVITPDGECQTLATGLGRPQGIALDREQNLYIVSHVGGEGGVFKRTPDGELQQVVAGVNLVGIAFGMDTELILTD